MNFSILSKLAGFVPAKLKTSTGPIPNPGRGWFGTRGGAYLRGTVVGHGVVPVEACLRILKAAAYDDVVAIEFEGMEPCEEALELGLENIKRML